MNETAKVVVLSPEELKSLIREAVTEALKANFGGFQVGIPLFDG